MISADAPPLPRPRILRQSWLDLTFVHWAVEPESIARFYPPGTRPDTFEGRAYVGLVPFRMARTGFARGPALVGDFLETNIRLYSIDSTGRRGVVFLSLDANRRDVVAIARTVFALPYRFARMQYDVRDQTHTYTTQAAGFSSRITARVGAAMEPGDLEHFLTARWGLHTQRAGRTWYLPNEHPAWELRSAELLDLEAGSLLTSVGLRDLSTRPPDHVAHSSGVRSYFGLPRRTP
ncbi:DUF2071 domain-containing protein [Kribbella sp. NPDC051770]|uniref:YqjF family protein n=1 Tax=Kribbella sp. NPDC051770 TaxID=3155413 RepID=UPI00344ABE4F